MLIKQTAINGLLNRILSVTVLVVLLLAVQASVAEARCSFARSGSPDEVERDNALIKRSAFIGVIKIKSFTFTNETCRVLGKGGYEVIAEPVNTYVGHLPESARIKGCWQIETVSPPKVGQLYKRLILENEDQYYFTGQCQFLSENKWQELEAKTNDSEKFQELERRCQETGGTLLSIESAPLNSYARYNCFHSASDYKNECADSLQCEGVCVAELSREEEQKVFTVGLGDGEPVEATGYCSEWRERHGCYYEVENGYVRKRSCDNE